MYVFIYLLYSGVFSTARGRINMYVLVVLYLCKRKRKSKLSTYIKQHNPRILIFKLKNKRPLTARP